MGQPETAGGRASFDLSELERLDEAHGCLRRIDFHRSELHSAIRDLVRLTATDQFLNSAITRFFETGGHGADDFVAWRREASPITGKDDRHAAPARIATVRGKGAAAPYLVALRLTVAAAGDAWEG